MRPTSPVSAVTDSWKTFDGSMAARSVLACGWPAPAAESQTHFGASSVRGTPIRSARATVCSASSTTDPPREKEPGSRDRSFARSISASYPASSTVRPFSSHMSNVRSTGKPYVSYILKASSPESVPPAGSFSQYLPSWRIPFLSVREKVASSSRRIALTRSGSLRSSGNASPNCSTTASTSWWKKPSGALRISPPYRTARRRIRRST
mmetsp:Transcript_12788/g.40956  ORF Transcript_12788/g.40956 Transcript_12788/m.40956 type:complete len:208 (+) Transcript_12788:1601-2224(+)